MVKYTSQTEWIDRRGIFLWIAFYTGGLGGGLYLVSLYFNSLWGMGLTLFGFIPAGIYRARLEEEALARRFGKEWDEYTARTFFFLPPLI